MAIERTELAYEGKSKQVWRTTDPERVLIAFKDDATAFNGARHARIAGKGELNAAISALLFERVGAAGIRHHLVEARSAVEHLCRRVEVVPVEVVVRNRVAGSFSKRYGLAEGAALPEPVVELFVKSDALGDPLIGFDAAVALGLARAWELHQMIEEARRINAVLTAFWAERGADLIDFKVEFGRTADGALLLADELTPDGCRLWDRESGAHLDKDVFRRDLGDLAATYAEVLRRATGADRALS